MLTSVFNFHWGFLLRFYSNHSSEMDHFDYRHRTERQTDERTDGQIAALLSLCPAHITVPPILPVANRQVLILVVRSR